MSNSGRKTHSEEIRLIRDTLDAQIKFNKEVTTTIKKIEAELNKLNKRINRHDEMIIDIGNDLREHKKAHASDSFDKTINEIFSNSKKNYIGIIIAFILGASLVTLIL